MFDALAPIELGDDVALGHGVLITTAAHRIGTAERRAGLVEPKPIRIGHGAWLASRSVILPGVEVGDGAIVAAGAVVTQSVPPNVLVAGVPAKVVREL
ncbi:MAG: DapH/DapD/GlmU-related protein [Acidimicrobiales bacterium]